MFTSFYRLICFVRNSYNCLILTIYLFIYLSFIAKLLKKGLQRADLMPFCILSQSTRSNSPSQLCVLYTFITFHVVIFQYLSRYANVVSLFSPQLLFVVKLNKRCILDTSLHFFLSKEFININ